MTAHGIKYIGKESNQLEGVEAGIHNEPTEVLSQYSDPQHDEWIDVIRPALVLAVERGDTTDSEIAREVGVNRSTVGRWRREETRPHDRQRVRLLDYLTDLAGTDWHPGAVPRDRPSQIAVWLVATATAKSRATEEIPNPKSRNPHNL